MPSKRRSSEAIPPAKRSKATSSGSSLTPDTISKDDFEDILRKFLDIVPEKLQTLDFMRYEEIPSKVQSRKPRHLTGDELVTLVEWKLKHGTFRPNLLAMAKKHDTTAIQDITTTAFKREPAEALKVLCTLRGIGPATASLLLSCADPSVPFFSDELYRWMMLEEGGTWESKIGYTPKEYLSLLERVRVFAGKHDVPAIDIEKVAYVCARLS